MSFVLAALAVGLGTYLSRAIFILALAKKQIPEPVLVMLQFVAPAVLGALVVALLIDSDGSVSLGAPELLAFVAGGATAYKTRNHIATLLVGMTVFWMVRAIL